MNPKNLKKLNHEVPTPQEPLTLQTLTPEQLDGIKGGLLPGIGLFGHLIIMPQA